MAIGLEASKGLMLVDNALVLVATAASAYTYSTFRTQQNKSQVIW